MPHRTGRILAALLLCTVSGGALSAALRPGSRLDLSVGQASAAPATPRPRPNIVWISNEDMSPRLGAYGDAVARTPVLDRLARESIRYTRAFTTAPVCAPSRAAIITGMYQNAHRRAAHADDRGQRAGAAGPVSRGAAVLCEGVSGVSARGWLLHDEPRQDRLPVRRAVHDLGRGR